MNDATDEATPPRKPPVALTIAGSDSGGGAGIAADLRTFACHGVFGTLALTAVTAQDTCAVTGVMALPVEFVELQIDTVLGDFSVGVAKTGMLATLPIIEMILERARGGRLPPLVVDPVMVATSGAVLIEKDAVRAYRALLPHALVVTPNLKEAEVLLERSISTKEEMRSAARELCDRGATFSLVKGGHKDGPIALDVACHRHDLVELEDEMIRTDNLHGTGCTLSAAITANIAKGDSPLEAIAHSKAYVHGLIAKSADINLGSGPGPLDHFDNL